MEFIEDEEVIANVTGQNQNLDGDDEDEKENPSQKMFNKEVIVFFIFAWVEENGLYLHKVVLLRIRQKAVNLNLKKFCIYFFYILRNNYVEPRRRYDYITEAIFL